MLFHIIIDKSFKSKIKIKTLTLFKYFPHRPSVVRFQNTETEKREIHDGKSSNLNQDVKL